MTMGGGDKYAVLRARLLVGVVNSNMEAAPSGGGGGLAASLRVDGIACLQISFPLDWHFQVPSSLQPPSQLPVWPGSAQAT